uniref:Serine/threonine-protein phosphatase 2A activator n=1 Tax=Lygus hesperus TaxID=30085 RepID=A0A0A9W6X0_LYGHE
MVYESYILNKQLVTGAYLPNDITQVPSTLECSTVLEKYLNAGGRIIDIRVTPSQLRSAQLVDVYPKTCTSLLCRASNPLLQQFQDGVPIASDIPKNDSNSDSPAMIVTCYEELHSLFIEAFGNATRIDYGTGHELAFFSWATALMKLGILR